MAEGTVDPVGVGSDSSPWVGRASFVSRSERKEPGTDVGGRVEVETRT